MWKVLEKQGWHGLPVHPGRAVVLEGVHPVVSAQGSHAPVSGMYGRGWVSSSAQAQRTKGLTVPNSALPPPALPLLCTSCV